MRDPNRIDPLICKLRELWIKLPDWRLGQLITNVVDNAPDTIFNIEDDVLLKRISDLNDGVLTNQDKLDMLMDEMIDWANDDSKMVKTRHVQDWLKALAEIKVARD